MDKIIDSRIRRLEEILQNDTEIGMVAIKTDQGIKWNGVTYPDDESLHEAMETICGRKTRKPLVIIAIKNGKKDTQ
jgi:hypothetical protein